MASEWNPYTTEPRMPNPANLARRRPTAQVLIYFRVVVNNWTQADLAERAGVEPTSLATWETRAPVAVESWQKLQAVIPDLPQPWAFDPPLLHNHTGQPAVPPPGTTLEELDAQKAKIAAIVLPPPPREDGWAEYDAPPPPPKIRYLEDGTRIYRDGRE